MLTNFMKKLLIDRFVFFNSNKEKTKERIILWTVIYIMFACVIILHFIDVIADIAFVMTILTTSGSHYFNKTKSIISIYD